MMRKDSKYSFQNSLWEDGCKVYFTDGSWVICRFSGTEPLLRVMVEAPDDALCRACVDEVVSVIKQSGHAL